MIYSIDFEFKNSQEKNLNLVCCVITSEKETKKFWVYSNPGETKKLKNYLDTIIIPENIFLMYYGSAECRALLTLGYSAEFLYDNLKIVDCFVAWKMLKYDKDIMYGTWFNEKGEMNIATPPDEKKGEMDHGKQYEDDDGKLHTYSNVSHYRTGNGLADVIANRLRVNINSEEKKKMRDLILTRSKFSKEEEKSIIDYCEKDVKYLRPLAKQLISDLSFISDSQTEIQDILIHLSNHMISCAVIESNGLPVLADKIENFANNFAELDEDLIKKCNAVYPLYRWSDKHKKWIEDYQLYEQMINGFKFENFPRSLKSGKLKKDKKTLKAYESIKTIDAFFQTKISRSDMKLFRKYEENIKPNIGSDSRIRILSSPFGTGTSRHTPSIKQGWFLGFTYWMRPVMGFDSSVSDKIIIGGDYASQEISVAAELAQDINLQEAYASHDPYIWFAKQSGFIPDTVGRKDGEWYDKGEKIDGIYYKKVRTLFKVLMLGIGYGMGAAALAKTLTSAKMDALTKDEKDIVNRAITDPEFREKADDIIMENTIYEEAPPGVSEIQTAKYYLKLYREAFPNVWKYRDEVKNRFRTYRRLHLADGWSITGLDKDQTALNFPIQGGAQVIFRKAIENTIRAGLEICAVWHDAIYIVSSKEDKDKNTKLLDKCMRDAVVEILEKDCIRVECNEYTTDWTTYTSTWTKEKGVEFFAKFGKYFLPLKN